VTGLKDAKHLTTYANSAVCHMNQMECAEKTDGHPRPTTHPTLHGIILTASDPSFSSNKELLLTR
jgi:hypothetical protein